VLKSGKKEIYSYYPIKAKLKSSLFDPQAAQHNYRKNILHTKNTLYQKLFYFSPYKVFNANQTISYIRKGNANIFIDDVQSAQGYLKQGFSSSDVNLGITKAIQDALNFKLRAANKKLLSLVKIQPKHSILQYNLALTYAQLGDMKKANEHFTRSYYLDSKNYLSGVYAVLTAQLIHRPYKRLKSILKDSIYLEKDGEEKNLYITLLALSENNYISAIDWLDHNYNKRPLHLMLNIIIATKLKKYSQAQKASEKLLAIQPQDILPNLIYIDTHFYDATTSDYAKKVLSYLKSKQFHYQDLYYGAYITRYLFIQEKLITGQLYKLRMQLSHILSTTTQNTQELTSSLALASLYDKAFEESYTLYNHLIDDLKVRDAYTLYLGAVASTAANHHGNAIALLELSKIKNKSFYESRFALALLYMEIDNYEGATIEFERIEEDGFISNFFEFEIDTEKLLFKKQHPQD
jgi:Tfp pilus assembly protein PilF